MTGVARQSIDIGYALDLLAGAVKQRGGYYAARRGSNRLLGQALALARISDDELELLGELPVRTLYSLDRLPFQLTLGALVVFDAAQRIEGRGYTWGEALDYAADAAIRYLDLVPDLLFASGSASTGSCPS